MLVGHYPLKIFLLQLEEVDVADGSVFEGHVGMTGWTRVGVMTTLVQWSACR